MKSIYLMLVALIAQIVVAKEYPYKSSFYGCPDECHAEKNPKCSDYDRVPSDRMFAAIPTEYFDKYDEKFCGMSYVGMIIDSKADKSYKMIRATIVDQCGTCDRHQIDLSSKAFQMMADGDHGVVSMVYVFVDKSGKIVEGPIYDSSDLESFASKQNISKSKILGSFKQAASNLAKNHGTGLKQYPWKSGEFVAEDHEEHEEHEEHEKKTTKKKTTTTTTRKTTTKKTTTTTTTVKKTIPKPKATTTQAPKIVTTLAKTTTVAAVKSTPAVTIQPVKPIPKPVAKPVEKPAVKPKEKTEKTEKSHEEEKKPVENENVIIEDETNENKDGSNLGAVGAIGAVGAAAGLGLLMLKRKSPEKYEDLKQKFPEAFGTVKRSLTRGASTIKRGVSRSVSRSGRNFRNEQTAPLPASYTFTLNTEDGLPRVALYDDPYPTKTHGTQHW